jgi:hypothetical protein
VAAYGHDLYFAWVGASAADNLYYSAFNGSSWTAQSIVPSAVSYDNPALAAYDGDLYASWVNSPFNGQTYFAAFNGSVWTSNHVIPSSESDWGPALAVAEGQLYDVWGNYAAGAILDYSRFKGMSPEPPVAIPSSATACVGPALASFQSRLVVAWTGPGNSNDCDGTTSPVDYSSGP